MQSFGHHVGPAIVRALSESVQQPRRTTPRNPRRRRGLGRSLGARIARRD